MKQFVAPCEIKVHGKTVAEGVTVTVTDGYFGVLNDNYEIDAKKVENVSAETASKSNKKVESLTAELEESNKKVESLTTELEKVSSEAVTTIEDLKGLVLEAVKLKGKEPEGFKKYKG